MTTAVKRACDACHRRKVKCDGINPCRNCSSAQLGCTYNAIPQKKGPKGSRAKVISELRETQRATSLSAKVQGRLNGIHSPGASSKLSPNLGLLAPELVKHTIEFFFDNMYSSIPVLSRQRLEQQALYMETSLDAYCLITSMAAFVLLQPGMTVPGGDPLFEHPGANIASSQLLMEEAIRARRSYDCTESPTLYSLCTSYFLFGCFYAMELHDKAWFHLREATTLAHIAGLNQEEKYMRFDKVESARYRRLYWLLFATERTYALKYGRPLTLQASIDAPSLTDDPTDPQAHQLNGYFMLVNLFRSIDDSFMLAWNKTRAEITPTYQAVLQSKVAELPAPYLNGTDSHFTDVRSNQQWLKTISWHLSQQHNGAHGEELTYQYPIDVSRDLASLSSHFQSQSTDLLGVPLVARLMDIACALIDLLSIQPAGDPFSIGPQQHLQVLLQILNALRGGEHHLAPLLLVKVNEILPRMANPMLQRAPDNMVNIDIFDGFGNAGMAQPPVMTDFKQESFKTEPYTPAPVQRLDEMVTETSSSNGGASTSDLNSPFPMTSSPSVVSPTMEYPQHQQMGDFSSMPEMMMSSLNQSAQPSLTSQPNSMNQQQHHGYHTQRVTSNPAIHSQLQNGSLGQMNHNMASAQAMAMHQQSHGHTQHFSQLNQSHINQGMMNNMMHRQAPHRTMSYSMHQPQQIRTIGDFQALQRANSENVTMGNMNMSPVATELDFNTLR